MPPRRQSLVYLDPRTGQYRLRPDVELYTGVGLRSPVGNTTARAERDRRRKMAIAKAVEAARSRAQTQAAATAAGAPEAAGYGAGAVESTLAMQQTPEGLDRLIERGKGTKLGHQVNRQIATAEKAGEEVPAEAKGEDKSVINRIFDVMSRGNFMMANLHNEKIADIKGSGADTPLEHLGDVVHAYADIPGSLKAAAAGLSGKEKTTYSKVLKENEILKGKPAAVAGLGLDVALDPTTYVSLGSSVPAKIGAKAGVIAAGRTAAEELTERGLKEVGERAAIKGKGEIEDIAEHAAATSPHASGLREAAVKDVLETIKKTEPIFDPKKRAALRRQFKAEIKAEAKIKGTPLDPADLKKLIDSRFAKERDAVVATAYKLSDDELALRKALGMNRQLELRVLGRPVLSSVRAGTAINRAGTAIREGPLAGLNAAFRTNAVTGPAIHTLRQRHMNLSASYYEDQLRQIQKEFRGTKKKARIAITHAIEAGDTTSLTPKDRELYDFAVSWMKDLGDQEEVLGALKATERKDNYVYHIYHKRRLGTGIGSPLSPGRGGAKNFETIAEAKKFGARPVEDIADILASRTAKSHRIQAHYRLMNDITDKFGIELKGNSHFAKSMKKLVDDKLLVGGRTMHTAIPHGVYFDKDTATAIAKIGEVLKSDESVRGFFDTFDKIQSRWKFAVIGYNPGAQVRNLMGDTFVNFLDGVVNPVWYSRAAKAIGAAPGDFKIKVGGEVIDGDEIKALYDAQGLQTGFMHAETNVLPEGAGGAVFRSNNLIRRGSEKREDWARMAHFIHAMASYGGKGKTVDEIALLAAARVKKYNFDYQDLTHIERNVLRRAVPFYTYLRKSMPLMLETFATRPGRVAVVPKVNRMMAGLLGEDVPEEPLPGIDGVIPDWIRDMPGIQLSPSSLENNATFVQPDLPVNQIEEWFGGFDQGPGAGAAQIVKTGAGALSPIAKFPLDVSTKKDLATGMPTAGTNWKEILADQLPLTGALRQTQIGPALNLRDESGREAVKTDVLPGEGEMSERLLNYILGIGARTVTPRRQSSELRRRQDIVQALIAKIRADEREQRITERDERMRRQEEE